MSVGVGGDRPDTAQLDMRNFATTSLDWREEHSL